MVVVVDGLGDVRDGHRAQARHHLLDAVQVIGGFQGVIPTDGDQGIDLKVFEGLKDVQELVVARRIGQIVPGPDGGAGIGAGVVDQHPLGVAQRGYEVEVEVDIVLPLFEFQGAEILEILISPEESGNTHTGLDAGRGGSGDDGVGRRGRTTGKDDPHVPDGMCRGGAFRVHGKPPEGMGFSACIKVRGENYKGIVGGGLGGQRP